MRESTSILRMHCFRVPKETHNLKTIQFKMTKKKNPKGDLKDTGQDSSLILV